MQSRLTDLYQANQSNRKFTTTPIIIIYLSKNTRFYIYLESYVQPSYQWRLKNLVVGGYKKIVE